MNKVLAGIIGFVVFVGVVLVAIRIFTPEDTWLCQNGTWIKHGSPSMPMPTTGCGSQDEGVKPNMANPASVNCEEKGGQLKMETDVNGGQYGICVFPRTPDYFHID